MKQKLTYHSTANRQLLLFFAGWGMDANPFETLRRESYDVMVVWDYSTDSFDTKQLDGYSEICIMAWSFGVYEAATFIRKHPRLPVTRTIAVNGTLSPVDDEKGIPQAIFNGTLENMSERNLAKFYRRMCIDSSVYADFCASAPQRPVDELSHELSVIGASAQSAPNFSPDEWDVVYISASDRIIPTANQHNAWSGHKNIKTLNAGHLVDFNEILKHELIDKRLVANRFEGSQNTYDTHATVQKLMAEHLADLTANAIPQGKPVDDMLEIGVGSGLFTRCYLERMTPKRLTLCDLGNIPESLPGTHIKRDGELYVKELPADSFDVVTSASTIQWFNSVGAFMAECHRILHRDGLLSLSTFGPATFKELSRHLSNPLEYPSAEALIHMSTGKFSIIAVEESIETIEFESTAKLLEHMRLTGVNATSSDARSSISAVRNILREGHTSLTYNPIYILLKKL